MNDLIYCLIFFLHPTSKPTQVNLPENYRKTDIWKRKSRDSQDINTGEPALSWPSLSQLPSTSLRPTKTLLFLVTWPKK